MKIYLLELSRLESSMNFREARVSFSWKFLQLNSFNNRWEGEIPFTDVNGDQTFLEFSNKFLTLKKLHLLRKGNSQRYFGMSFLVWPSLAFKDLINLSHESEAKFNKDARWPRYDNLFLEHVIINQFCEAFSYDFQIKKALLACLYTKEAIAFRRYHKNVYNILVLENFKYLN